MRIRLHSFGEVVVENTKQRNLLLLLKYQLLVYNVARDASFFKKLRNILTLKVPKRY